MIDIQSYSEKLDNKETFTKKESLKLLMELENLRMAVAYVNHSHQVQALGRSL